MRWLVVIFAVPFLAGAQVDYARLDRASKIDYYLTEYIQTTEKVDEAPADFLAFIKKLEQKKETFDNQHDFLRHLFVKTHQRFLKHYETYSPFSELFKSGTYNCLTGTALYALLLDYFRVDYQVIETNYHIFILVNTDHGGQLLIEATDPVNGFIDNSLAIDHRISLYRKNEMASADSGKSYYHLRVDLFDKVGLDQLLGLLYYNLSIVDYNGKNLPDAVRHFDKAVEFYPSPRLDEFSKIILLSISESELDFSVKENLIRKIQLIRKRKLAMLVSAKAF